MEEVIKEFATAAEQIKKVVDGAAKLVENRILTPSEGIAAIQEVLDKQTNALLRKAA